MTTRPEEPKVSLRDRESLIRWLEWNDHNGCYSDEDCRLEGLNPLSIDDARRLYLEQSNQR